jgi:phage terminase large subunit-like protein
VIAELSDEEANVILHDWEFWARPAQFAPPGDWVHWLILAGRGFGKTRVGAEQVRRWTKEFPIVNLIGPTAADVRDMMVQGIGAVCAMRIWRLRSARLARPYGRVKAQVAAPQPALVTAK